MYGIWSAFLSARSYRELSNGVTLMVVLIYEGTWCSMGECLRWVYKIYMDFLKL